MCEWDDTVEMDLKILAYSNHTGKEFIKLCKIDRCIASIVKALNDGGVRW